MSIKKIQYDAVTADLYMKTLIAYAKEKKIRNLQKETVQYLRQTETFAEKEI